MSALWMLIPGIAALSAMLLTGRAVTCSRGSSRILATKTEAPGCHWLWIIVLNGVSLLGLWDLLKT
jgi:hypothetical protein